jgi:RNA polymerase sigma-70 factor (ECF subfamily)
MLRSIEPSDEVLAERVVERDLDAFATLYQRYAPRVFTWAARTLGPGEAEDVSQDVFLRLWDRAAQFDPARGRFGAWFAAVTRNEIVGRLRRRTREQRILASEELDELLSGAADGAPAPDTRAWMTDRDATLAAAVRELPLEQRRVIVMAYFGGLSQSEIAAALAAPLGTVKKRTSLALAKLRHAVVDDAPARSRNG